MNTAALDADLNYHFKYSYDRAGNRTQQYYRYTNPPFSNTVSYSYNAANQLLNDQNYNYGYDANGNRDTILPSSTYASWDRANRMVSGTPGTMLYDGQGNRVKQTDGVNATAYLLDMQPGLAQTLAETLNGTAVTRFVHGPRGIHAQKDATNNWEWMLQDGLGSVRLVVDNNGNVLESRLYDPYGGSFGATGTNQTSYNFTGEQQAGSTDLLYLRARYYSSSGGVFTALDPFEGKPCDPMSLNGYSYVAGNPVNMVDPSGMIYELPSMYASCAFHFASFLQSACDNPSLTCVEKCQCWANTTRSSGIGLEACLSGCGQVSVPKLGARLAIFPDAEYPQHCTGMTATDCMLYHLNFLVNTKTIEYLHNVSIKGTYDTQLFLAFVAPDDWATHPEGTPADIKRLYENLDSESPRGSGQCMTVFDKEVSFDFAGNLAFGYIGARAGYPSDTLLTGAGFAQIIANFFKEGNPGKSSVDFWRDWGDAPEDQVAVRMGIRLYELCGLNCSASQVDDIITSMYGDLVEAASNSPTAQCHPSLGPSGGGATGSW